MACIASTGGFCRVAVRPVRINCPLKVGVVRGKQKEALKSVRVKMAYSQRAPSSCSVSCSASLYQLLSIPPDSSSRDVKSAYRRMALRYHPDVCPPEEKEECSRRFVEVQAAYETLSDPILRQDYDWRLQNKLDFSENMGNSGMNSSAWEAQVVELIRRSNSEREWTWGGRMRSRNQHTDAAPSAR